MLAFWWLSHFHCICQLLNKVKQHTSSLITGCSKRQGFHSHRLHWRHGNSDCRRHVQPPSGFESATVRPLSGRFSFYPECVCPVCTSLALICGASFPCVLWTVVRASSCMSPVRSVVTCLGLGEAVACLLLPGTLIQGRSHIALGTPFPMMRMECPRSSSDQQITWPRFSCLLPLPLMSRWQNLRSLCCGQRTIPVGAVLAPTGHRSKSTNTFDHSMFYIFAFF